MSERKPTAIVGALVLLLCLWIGYKVEPAIVEKYYRLLHRCPMEWYGPEGPLNTHSFVCTETGEVKGMVYRDGWSDKDTGPWRAYHGNKVFMTLKQAMNAEEKAAQ